MEKKHTSAEHGGTCMICALKERNSIETLEKDELSMYIYIYINDFHRFLCV